MLTRIDTKSKLKQRKIASLSMAERLKRLGFVGRSERMANCMNRVDYAICEKCGKIHITQTYLCRDRLCSICAAGLARKRWWDMIATAEAANGWKGHNVAMLTLTIRNCKPELLQNTLKSMSLAYKRLTQRKYWKDNISGYARQLEFTYNVTDNTIHPHYHIMLILDKSIKKEYIGKLGKNIAQEWKHALRISYNPIYDIRLAYNKNTINLDTNSNMNLISYYSEMSKYMCKPLQILGIPKDKDMLSVISAINGTRTSAYGGCVKEARLKAHIDDDNALEQTNISLNCCDTDMIIASAHWAMGEWISNTRQAINI